VVSVTYPYGRILGFLDRSSYFFFQVAPQLYSTRLSGPRFRHTTSQKICRISTGTVKVKAGGICGHHYELYTNNDLPYFHYITSFLI
jgi:hypothetical protein